MGGLFGTKAPWREAGGEGKDGFSPAESQAGGAFFSFFFLRRLRTQPRGRESYTPSTEPVGYLRALALVGDTVPLFPHGGP